MIHLPSVTAVIIDTVNHQAAISAIVKTLRIIKPARLLFLTDMEIEVPGAEVVKIDQIKSKEEYSEFCIKKLNPYILTEHLLIFQWDGFPINEKAWNDDFLKYDYVGAPWQYDERNVGNGGFSLRSKRLHTVLADDNWIDVVHPEDQSICIIYRYYLEQKYSIKFAPFELAEQFAYESLEPVCPTFGFHNFAGKPYKPVVVIKRTGAMGDVIAAEPVMAYFFNQGYRVFLDTLPDFYLLFIQHHYPVEYFKHINPRMPYKLIDLDMAYEKNPKQTHLLSYYDAAGIPMAAPKRPVLSMKLAEEDGLFKKKTAVIHYGERPQGGRNIYDFDWDTLVAVLNAMDYDVIQVGLGEHIELDGVVSFHTASTNLLQLVVASCDLFVGADSGVSHIAVAHGIPSVIFFGNVKAEYIHPDLSNICVIENEPACITPHCWHNVIGTQGMECYINEQKPPCAVFDTESVIAKIHKFLNK